MKNTIRKLIVFVLALTFVTGIIGTQAAAAAKPKTDGASSSYEVLGLEDMPECDYLDIIRTYHYIQTSDYYTMGLKVERTEAVDGINTYTKDVSSASYSVDGYIVSIDEYSKMYTEYTMSDSMVQMAKENLEKSLKNGTPKLSDRVFQKKGKGEIPQYSEDGDNKKYEYYEYLTEAASGDMSTSKTERFYMKDGDVFAIYTRASAGTLEVEATQVIKSISESIPKGTFKIPDLSGYTKYGENASGTEDGNKKTDDSEAKVQEGDSWYFGTNEDGYDLKKAEKCYKAAAKAGNGKGWYGLGRLYFEKRILTDDEAGEKAMKYFDKAIDAGCALGYYGKGLLYHTGTGVEKDYQKAQKLYQKAVDNGCPEGNLGLGELYEQGTAKGLEKPDGKKALKYYKKAAESTEFQGRNRAYIDIGQLYEDGTEGITQDFEKAMKYFKKAAKNAYPPGYSNVGYLYYYGEGVEQDYEKALSQFKKGRKAGNSAAMIWLGDMYFYGYAVGQDPAKAVELYEEAVENGAEDGLAKLGYCYITGQGAETDYQKGLAYYTRYLAAVGSDEKYAEGVDIVKNNIALMVEYGHITQEQADAALAAAG